MGLIDNAIEAFRFKDTIFYKDSSDLQDKYNALSKLVKESPNNEELLEEFYMVKKGLEGEEEVSYQLKKANIGMYVLRDIKVQYEDMNAQIDYVVITPYYCYYIECKNLVGNITVNEKGDFIREIIINGNKIKKGMYSPLRQVEAQREVLRKIWESHTGKITKLFIAKNFEHYRKVLVVAANHETILDTSNAPKDIKYRVLRVDGLIRQIQYDIDHCSKDEYRLSKKDMEESAQSYVDVNIDKKIDYYDYYKRKYSNNKIEIEDSNALRERLIKFRKDRANELNLPPYYVFNNEELDKLVEVKPKTIEELVNSNILPPIKFKTHGKQIIEIINIRP